MMIRAYGRVRTTRIRRRRGGRWFGGVLLLGSAAVEVAAAPTYAEVAAIFNVHCVICHSGPQAALGLRLDDMAGILQGSQRGPVVRSGDPHNSELLRRVRGISQPRMPMTGPPFLSDAEVKLLEEWIAAGLPAAVATPQPAEASATTSPPASGSVSFAQVAPILARRCAKCHTDQGLMGPAPEGYRLTSYEAVVSASDRLRVVPGSPDASELVRRIRGQAAPRMPFDGPPYLAESEIALIEAWVEQGARDTAGRPRALPVNAPVRLHGVLEPGWHLDGLPLRLDGAIRLKKAPCPGDYVEVRGRVAADGTVLAERIRPR